MMCSAPGERNHAESRMREGSLVLALLWTTDPNQTVDGTGDDNFIFDQQGSSTLNGGDGNDLLIGDYGGVAWLYDAPDEVYGSNKATADAAESLTANTNYWQKLENPDIVDSTTTAHTSFVWDGMVPQEIWIRIDGVAGETITLDVDYGIHDIGENTDTFLTLLAADGITEVAGGVVGGAGDVSLLTNGLEGSTSTDDAFLSYQFLATGTYYIRLRESDLTGFDGLESFILNISLTGQATNDSLYATGADILDGGAGNDVIYGGAGDDTLDSNLGNDRAFGGVGDDTFILMNSLFGPARYDTLGADLYDGGDGYDTVDYSGIQGNNIASNGQTFRSIEAFTYTELPGGGAGLPNRLELSQANFQPGGFSSSLAITVNSGLFGFRLIQVSGSFSMANWIIDGAGTFAPVIQGDHTVNNFIGSSGDDTFFGFDGADTLEGGAGSDTLLGGEDPDTYVLGDDTAADVINDDGTIGPDLITSLISRSLANYTGVENLTLLGSRAANATGNGVANTLTGNNAANRFTGGDSLDWLIGRGGNDTYVLENGTDDVIDSAGIDTVTSTINRVLSGAYAEVENLTLLGTATSGTGSGLRNVLIGNSRNNTLSGLGNNDTLDGQGGRDTYILGPGNDTVRFTNKSHSPNNGNRDTVNDFDKGGTGDRLDVSKLFGPKMTYIHDAAFTKAGQVRINDIAGSDVIVEANTGGSLAADFSVRLKATTLASMNSGDFIL
jgi:Ca2+-binding RTX toxin-like protein